jgi:hypothetical protein
MRNTGIEIIFSFYVVFYSLFLLNYEILSIFLSPCPNRAGAKGLEGSGRGSGKSPGGGGGGYRFII